MNRQLVRRFATAATLLLSAVVSEAQAKQRNWSFSGIVGYVESPLDSYFAGGTSVQGDFTFNDSDVDTDPSPNLGIYLDPFVSAAISFSNGYSATFNTSPLAPHLILVDNNGFLGDFFYVAASVNGPNVSGLKVKSFSLWIRDYDNAMLSSDDLLTSPPDRESADEFRGFLSFETANQVSFAQVNFDLLWLRGVPEPSTAYLLGAVAATVLGIRRGKR